MGNGMLVPPGTPIIGQKMASGPKDESRVAGSSLGVQFNDGFVIAALCKDDKDQLGRIEALLEKLTNAQIPGTEA